MDQDRQKQCEHVCSFLNKRRSGSTRHRVPFLHFFIMFSWRKGHRRRRPTEIRGSSAPARPAYPELMNQELTLDEGLWRARDRAARATGQAPADARASRKKITAVA